MQLFLGIVAGALVLGVLYVIVSLAMPLKVPRGVTPFNPPSCQSVAVPGSASEGKGEIRRSIFSPNKLISTFLPNVETTYDLFGYALRNFSTRPFLGVREKTAKGYGQYVWKTYEEVDKEAKAFGSGLISLGVKQDYCVGIFSINRPEWTIAGIACNMYSMISVAIYDTLGDQAIRFVMSDANIRVVICNETTLPKLLETLKDCPTIELIVSMDSIDDATVSKYEIPERVKLYSWKQVVGMGQRKIENPIPPTPQSVFTISYTSGTTGNPKGVVLTHANIMAFVSSTLSNEQEGGKYDSKMNWLDRKNQDVYMSYLPLAHVMERALQELLIAVGAAVGFYTGDTAKLLDDVAVLRPTIFASVPRIFNRIYGKATAKLDGLKYPKRFIKDVFDYGYNQKLSLLKKGYLLNDTKWDRLLFKKVRKVLGGRVRIMVTGSAPIASYVLDWFRVVFGCYVLEGYGLTETCASVCGTRVDHLKAGSVGIPASSVEVRLLDVPEMGYHVTDKPRPRGEILVRGNTVFREYHNNPEMTAEAFYEGGWFRTGDIGTWNDDGTLTIIDRKKNIFKLAQGEYIAPEKIEQVCQRNSFVQQIFVHGDSNQSQLVAVVVPDMEFLKDWAKQQKLPDANDESKLCTLPAVRSAILTSLKETSRLAGLKGFEVIQAIHVESVPFSIEENLVTPSFKILRHNCRKKYEGIIASLYLELQASAK